ncbi:MAG: tetratricopeptide repeat protein [Treponema sp.]|jgi:tetratricopeptide (TPR) repeat protein|nr:tetratricopeptide repeat protein [Treponema sp.]
MFDFLKKLPVFRHFAVHKRREIPAGNDEIIQENWIADFSAPGHAYFNLNGDASYDTGILAGELREEPVPPTARTPLGRAKEFFSSGMMKDKAAARGSKPALVLHLKKTGCIAWVEAPGRRYRDQVIHARIRLDAHDGYAAAGLMFRMIDEGSRYMALISSKGYFRLEAHRNGMPLPLIGWTEFDGAGDLSGAGADLLIIAYGIHLILAVNGIWVGEIKDDSISAGEIAFVAVSYETPVKQTGPYTAEAFLEELSIESRVTETEEIYRKWLDHPAIRPQAYFRLAETFTAMNRPRKALFELQKAWEKPDHVKTPKELLLAGRIAQRLDMLAEAEEYIDGCLALEAGYTKEGCTESPEICEAITEKAKILYAAGRFKELKAYAEKALRRKNEDPLLHTLRGHAYLQFNDYEKAAEAYDEAFRLDGGNGILAKNAANMYEMLEKREEALERYLKAGGIFLNQGNYDDLGILISKMLMLGPENWKVHGLAGKWAFGIDDWPAAAREFARAEELRRKLRPVPDKDPALVFLCGLLFIREGKRREGLVFLDEAVSLAPDYALFRFKAAENRFILQGRPDPGIESDLEAALALSPDDGWICNFAAQVNLSKGDLDGAAPYLEKASRILGNVPAIRVNQAVLFYLQGNIERSLGILCAERTDDPEGLMANCAGNLLFRAGRFEEADVYYLKALSIAPDNVEYLCNRASCLIELSRLGEADELLSKAHSQAPSPSILELIGYVAGRKGEFQRAESACRAALEMESDHVPSLLSLCWIFTVLNRWDEARAICGRLEEMGLTGDAAARLNDLRTRIDDALTRLISCAVCQRNWRVPRSPPPAPPIRLFAMPPDELPAGACTSCGRTYCIGCAKEHLDGGGRFICTHCGKPLKLTDEGLKRIVYEWASRELHNTAGPETPERKRE